MCELKEAKEKDRREKLKWSECEKLLCTCQTYNEIFLYIINIYCLKGLIYVNFRYAGICLTMIGSFNL